MQVGDHAAVGNHLIASMSPECQVHIGLNSLTKPIHSGEIIHEPGAPVQNLVFPHDGQISIQYFTKEGRAAEVMSVGADGAVGIDHFLGDARFHYLAIVVISGRASWIPVRDFQTAIEEHPCVRPIMRAYIERRAQQLMQAVACASVHSAIQRLSTWLLQAEDRNYGDSFDITQRTLADILGFRLATISESCNRLLGLGAIHYSRGTLRIVDRALLEAQACECYDLVRLRRPDAADGE